MGHHPGHNCCLLVFEYKCVLCGVIPCTDATAPCCLRAVNRACPVRNSDGCLINAQELRLYTSGKLIVNDANNSFKAFHTLWQTSGKYSHITLLRLDSLTPKSWSNTKCAVRTSPNGFLGRGHPNPLSTIKGKKQFMPNRCKTARRRDTTRKGQSDL